MKYPSASRQILSLNRRRAEAILKLSDLIPVGAEANSLHSQSPRNLLVDNSRAFRYKKTKPSNSYCSQISEEEDLWFRIPHTTCPESLPTFFTTMSPPPSTGWLKLSASQYA